MAQLKKKIRKKKRLGPPPKMEEVSNNLDEPETFTPKAPAPALDDQPTEKIDGRTLRRTGYTEQFNTKVPPGFKAELAAIAESESITFGKALVNALNIYKEHLKKED